MFHQNLDGAAKADIEVRMGSLTLQKAGLAFSADEVTVHLAGNSIAAEVEKTENGVTISFSEPVTINAGEKLAISAK